MRCQHIGLDHISHVREIANRGQVTIGNDWFGDVALDYRDSVGELAVAKSSWSTGPRVVESAQTYDVQPVRLKILKTKEILADFRNRIQCRSGAGPGECFLKL